MKTKLRVYFAWALVIISMIAWPVTSLTIFKSEQQGILGLSWAAIIIGAIEILLAADIRDKQ